ncbi:helix-turn-helix transcriptional regulator [Dictyobacter kobayashii]|uniref:helix-turn-helix transcriptional regulator n=1 Tax=Dictyobacter kobayashii TaxID=2014872 RepID=UPI000F8276D9
MNEPLHTNELIQRARKERGYTQRKLARELGVDEQTVGSWEREYDFRRSNFINLSVQSWRNPRKNLDCTHLRMNSQRQKKRMTTSLIILSPKYLAQKHTSDISIIRKSCLPKTSLPWQQLRGDNRLMKIACACYGAFVLDGLLASWNISLAVTCSH